MMKRSMAVKSEKAHLAGRVKDQTNPLRLCHPGRCRRETGHVLETRFPDRDGGLVHQEISEFFRGSGEAQHVEWLKVSEYLFTNVSSVSRLKEAKLSLQKGHRGRCLRGAARSLASCRSWVVWPWAPLRHWDWIPIQVCVF